MASPTGKSPSEKLPVVEDAFSDIRVWLDKLQYNAACFEDPVYEGIVREFLFFDHILQEVCKGVEEFMESINVLCNGMSNLSEIVVSVLGRKTDEMISKDAVLFREATHKITRRDAPNSSVAKMRRDLEFNIVRPLKKHLLNNRQLKQDLDYRRKKYTEMQIAQKKFDEIASNKAIQPQEKQYVMAEAALQTAKLRVKKIDKPTFEWLMMLDAYKCDICDSILQTIKYIQYEFLASSAHAVAHVLPARMEFRPVIEMTPDQLEPQVAMEIEEQEADANDSDGLNGIDATTRMLERWERDGAFTEVAEPTASVDPLSLSVLMGQGFEEGPSRRALRTHNNDTQAALDWLLQGMPAIQKNPPINEKGEQVSAEGGSTDVRMPTTLRWIYKLKEKMKKEREEKDSRAKKSDYRLRKKKNRELEERVRKSGRNETRRRRSSGGGAEQTKRKGNTKAGSRGENEFESSSDGEKSSDDTNKAGHRNRRLRNAGRKREDNSDEDSQSIDSSRSSSVQKTKHSRERNRPKGGNAARDMLDFSSEETNDNVTSKRRSSAKHRGAKIQQASVSHSLLDFGPESISGEEGITAPTKHTTSKSHEVLSSLVNLDFTDNTPPAPLNGAEDPTDFSGDIKMRALPDLLGEFDPKACLRSKDYNSNSDKRNDNSDQFGDLAAFL